MPWAIAAEGMAFVVFIALAIRGWMTKRWMAWAIFSLAFAVVLNVRFFIYGFASGLSQTTGFADLLLTVFHSDVSGLVGVATCPDNECTQLGNEYQWHTLWSIAFYNRFVHGPLFNQHLLYAHILFNTIAMVLGTYQLIFPGSESMSSNKFHSNRLHRWLGRASTLAMILGVAAGATLAAQHDSVSAYGGAWSKWGLWEMGACVFFTGTMGVRSILAGDVTNHRVWMWRHVGSLWGSFFAFRIIVLSTDPILINYPGIAWNLAAWGGAPAGILIAEWFRRKVDSNNFTRLQIS